MITKERLKEIATSRCWDNFITQNNIRVIAEYLVEQAEKQEAMKPRPRAKDGERYWYLDECFEVHNRHEDYYQSDDNYYNSGNYFLTEAEAQAFADKIKELRKTM